MFGGKYLGPWARGRDCTIVPFRSVDGVDVSYITTAKRHTESMDGLGMSYVRRYLLWTALRVLISQHKPVEDRRLMGQGSSAVATND